MLIQSPEGKRRVDEALVLCVDHHLSQGEQSCVTVFLFTGEQITGVVEQVPVDDLVELRMAA
jgi:hypothetical protein